MPTFIYMLNLDMKVVGYYIFCYIKK
jgi:hypothetical protein